MAEEMAGEPSRHRDVLRDSDQRKPSLRDGVLVVPAASREDADGVALVHVRAWQAAYPGLMSQRYLDSLDVAARADSWRRHLGESRNGSRLLLGTIDDGVAGFVGFGCARDSESGDGGELYSLNVHPDCWQVGVGSALLAEAEEGLVDLGYGQAVLWVASGNERACRFYERRGWAGEEVHRSQDVQGVTVSEVRLAKALP